MTDQDPHHPRFAALLDFLGRVPAVQTNETPSRGFGTGEDDANWWVKLSIDIDHPLAWNVVQEFGHASISSRSTNGCRRPSSRCRRRPT